MRVLLVNTNRMKPAIAPIGLDYLSDALRAAGYSVELLDLCFANDVGGAITEALRAAQPQVVGLSVRNTDDCYFSGQAFFLPDVREIVRAVRSGCDAPVVLGGAGFSVMPGAALEYCEADFGVAGEGEVAMVQLLQALEGKRDLSRVANLVYRAEGRVRRNPSVDIPLDDLPRSRSLPDNARYFAEGGQAGFETKRGCAMKCIYCADPVAKGRHVRLRSPRLVVEELKSLLTQGIDVFHTCDCEFNLPAEHALDVCREIVAQGLGDRIRWYAYCSVKPFDFEMADLFRRAGCAGIDFGADSGSDAMLGRLSRHFDSEDLRRTASDCHRAGIPFMYDLLIGGPGETRQSIAETIDLVRSIDADCVGLAMGVRVYEGTAMAEYVRSEGDPARNPNLHGARSDNPHFLRPVFYISPELGEGIVDHVRQLVRGDSRFFLPSNDEPDANYNYNDNTVLVRAIRDGARGAYWNILRTLPSQS